MSLQLGQWGRASRRADAGQLAQTDLFIAGLSTFWIELTYYLTFLYGIKKAFA